MTTGTGASAAYQATEQQARDRCQRSYLVGAMAAAGIEPQLLPEGGRPLSQLVVDAHYQGDLDEMRRLCLRAEAGLSPVSMRHLTDGQLDDRIGHIHVLLAAAYDEQQRRERTRSQRQTAERAAWLANELAKGRPLDPSDPS